MARSKKSSNLWLWVVGIGAALLLVRAAASAVGDLNGDGDKDINDVIAWLNGRFGKKWVTFGLDALLAAVPPPLGAILPIVFQVEQESLTQPTDPLGKRQRAQGLRNGAPQPA